MDGRGGRSLFHGSPILSAVKQDHRNALRERFGDLVRFDVELARFTTYRIGGPVAAVVEPSAADEVSTALKIAAAMDVPWMVLGFGSNVLLPDAGFDGIVLRMGKGMAGVQREGPEETVWTIGAGLPTPLLARRTAAAGLRGANRLIGVPGTVGGGVFMNAGAHGQEFRDIVDWVEVVAPDGVVSRVESDAIPWQYRSSGLQAVVVAAQLSLEPEDPRVLKRELRDHLRWRKSGTPFDQPCCGSVFRNPSKQDLRSATTDVGERCTAGRLVDSAGLKGYRVGGAEVSPMHANYIVNSGGATAADVRAVIDHVRTIVRDRFWIELRLEVKIVEPSS